MEERLQKIIARAGVASRRAAEKLMLEGRVEVDGAVVKELGTKVDPETVEIRVDGVRVRSGRRRRYLVLNKPAGYVTTRSDPGRRPTVMDLLPDPLRQSVFPVGRLDMSTTGLLIFTDDGDFAERIAHPRFGVAKTYRLTVRGCPDDATLERARKGIRLEGERLRVASVARLRAPLRRHLSRSPKETTALRVVLAEGRNRELRRLFRALGHPVLSLHRERVGTLSDRGLSPGAYRRLTPDEVSRLLAGAESRPSVKPNRGSRRDSSAGQRRPRRD